MSIPSKGWIPQAPQKSPAFEPPPANAYGERTQTAAKETGGFKNFLFGKDGADFYDVLDVVNPLQHIPFIGTLYRELTGDEIGHGARMAGGMLYGGVVGLAASAVNATVDAVSGRDMGEHAVAAYRGKEAKPADTPFMASLFKRDPKTEPQQVATARQIPPPDPVQPVTEPPARTDGMSHFAAFRPNAAPAETTPPAKQTGKAAAAMMSPAELAANLNKPHAAERRARIDRAEKSSQATGPGVSPPENEEKPSLSGNWFDSAMIDTLMKYQEMKQDRQPL